MGMVPSLSLLEAEHRMTEQPGKTREQRMQELLEKTRIIFLRDALQRCSSHREQIDFYRAGGIPLQELGKASYEYAHALKGVALTVGLPTIHELSERIVSYSIQQESAWIEESGRELLTLLQKLEQELNQAADAFT